MNDIEAVIISIVWPNGLKGNKAKPKLGKEMKLKYFIRKAIEKSQKEELRELGFGGKRKKNLQKKNGKRPDLKSYFTKATALRKRYKGKTYKATLLKSGKIKYKKNTYNTPTSAAQAIVHSKTVNGWDFWFVKDTENNWVKLSDLD